MSAYRKLLLTELGLLPFQVFLKSFEVFEVF